MTTSAKITIMAWSVSKILFHKTSRNQQRTFCLINTEKSELQLRHSEFWTSSADFNWCSAFSLVNRADAQLNFVLNFNYWCQWDRLLLKTAKFDLKNHCPRQKSASSKNVGISFKFCPSGIMKLPISKAVRPPMLRNCSKWRLCRLERFKAMNLAAGEIARQRRRAAYWFYQAVVRRFSRNGVKIGKRKGGSRVKNSRTKSWNVEAYVTQARWTATASPPSAAAFKSCAKTICGARISSNKSPLPSLPWWT